jgi:SanA protein
MTVILFTAVANAWVLYITHKHIFFDCKEIPANEFALVLGTSKRMVGGNPNPYFYYRMEAAAELYKYDKVKKFILSGDNRTKYYNEPNDMKIALMELGIPDSVITLDIAGLRTFDSVLRSKEIYGLDKVTIVTQGFHSSRAVFIGQYFDIEASAFVAKNRPLNKSFKLMIREYFARTKAVIDIVLSRFETFL